MSKLIALDDGHGMETAGKRTPAIPELGGRVIRENEFNRAVVKFLDEELRRCGFRTLIVAPGDADVSLKRRTDLANAKKADLFISIHYNAYDGKFDGSGKDPEGIEVFYYPGSVKGKKLAECVYKYLKQGTPQKLRGVKSANFHVLRETDMPAILSENGFMDNKKEAMLMLDVNFQKEVAREHCKGICEYFGVKYVPEPVKAVKEPEKKPKKVYKVQIGAFGVKKNAETLANKAKAAGFDVYIVEEEAK